MAASPAVSQLLRLIDAVSVTGDERLAVDAAEQIARDELGLAVTRMPVAEGRDNLLVGAPEPEVLLCTHIDVVPPHIGGRLEGDIVYGRGACDAKGVAVAMLHALARLDAAGQGDRVGCLLVVGEESDHAGAKRAAEVGPRPRHIILGEPCGLAPARAQKGLLKVRLEAEGHAGHSAYPELGASAVHRLLEALAAIRGTPLPADDDLGVTTVNVGRIEGGIAANVIAPHAEAVVLCRCAAPVEAVLGELASRAHGLATVTELSRAEPLEFDTVGAFAPGPAVPFNTDAHWLSSLGARISLFGPGDMRCAHGDGERLSVADLEAGIETYELVVRDLISAG